MSVSSVKNLNGETFSAVQDATLTDVVQSNSAQWGQGGGNPEVENYVQTNSGTIDEVNANVTTNSGAWGGSALPISAGPGIKVNLVDNTLVFSNDETVLYDRQGQYDANLTSVSVSEPLSSFEYVRFYDSKGGVLEKHFPSTDASTQYIRFAHYSQTLLWASIWKVNESNYTEITGNIGSLTNCLSGVVTGTPTEAGAGSPYNRWVIPMKIVGINRK